MPDREMIVKWFEFCRVEDKCSTDCPYWDNNGSARECTKELAKDVLTLLKYCGWNIPHRKSISNADIHFYAWLCRSAVAMLNEQEAVEPKTGHWIYKKYDDMFMCSSCEKYSIRNDYPYCHWCGAKMNQEGDGDG